MGDLPSPALIAIFLVGGVGTPAAPSRDSNIVDLGTPPLPTA